jgi:uncharacterized membrane protein YbhN (UPF0104 family)
MIWRQVWRWAMQPRVRRWVGVVMLALMATLLVIQGRRVDWQGIAAAMRAYPPATLGLAALLSALTYGIYSCFDLLSQACIGVRLRAHQVLRVAFVSYACNQNFGALLGTVGMRFRLYLGLGLEPGAITRLLALSVLTNWLGIALLGGVLFSAGIVSGPLDWPGAQLGLRAVGGAFLAVVGAYVLLGAGRTIRVRGEELVLPSRRIALLQFALSAAHWCATASILYVLLHTQIEFLVVLGTLVLSGCAAFLARVPAGLGVIEATFLALLGHRLPAAELLAALLLFRVFFNLEALALAAPVYLSLRGRIQGWVPVTEDVKPNSDARL